MKNLALNNVDNYKSELDSNEHILFLKYVGIIHELFQGCTENIYIQKEDYLKHVMIKGIKNTFYIYNFLLFGLFPFYVFPAFYFAKLFNSD